MPRLAALLCLFPSLAFAWGFDGHRRLASNLEEPFPAGSCLRGWLSTVTGGYTFQNKSCDPDRWRQNDADEGPRHYLNIDYADPIESYPREWSEVQARFGQYAVVNGTVPFRVEELYAQLVTRLQAQDAAAALDTIAWLSHYVTDAFSPLHDTKTQPGTCGATPDCLHLRYESHMLDVASQIDAITALARDYYGTVGKASPRHDIFDIVIAGHPVAQKIIYDDLHAGGDAAALYANTRELTARRWGDALTLMASLVGTAWVEAGKPQLAGMPAGCSTEVAEGPVVLAGFPLPVQQPDAGQAGGAEDAGASGGGGAPLPDAGVGAAAPDTAGAGCGGCGGGPLAALLPVFAVAAGVIARRRST